MLEDGRVHGICLTFSQKQVMGLIYASLYRDKIQTKISRLITCSIHGVKLFFIYWLTQSTSINETFSARECYTDHSLNKSQATSVKS